MTADCTGPETGIKAGWRLPFPVRRPGGELSDHATVAQAVVLYRTRGTPDGLRAHLEALTGGWVEVSDSGGVFWSATSDGPGGTGGEPKVVVRVTDPDPGASDPVVLQELVASAKPAHVPHNVEIVTEKHYHVPNG